MTDLFAALADERLDEKVRADNARNRSAGVGLGAPTFVRATPLKPPTPTITLPSFLIDDPNSFQTHRVELDIDQATQLRDWLTAVLEQHHHRP